MHYAFNGHGLSEALYDDGEAYVTDDAYPISTYGFKPGDTPFFFDANSSKPFALPQHEGWIISPVVAPAKGLEVTPAEGHALLLEHGWGEYALVSPGDSTCLEGLLDFDETTWSVAVLPSGGRPLLESDMDTCTCRFCRTTPTPSTPSTR